VIAVLALVMAAGGAAIVYALNNSSSRLPNAGAASSPDPSPTLGPPRAGAASSPDPSRTTLPPPAGAASSPVPSPTLDPQALRARLRAEIPPDIRPECSARTPVAPVVAAQECIIEDGGVRVVYSLFADTDSMNGVYTGIRTDLGVPLDSGQAGSRCTEAGTWPNEGPYTVRGALTGRLLCIFVAGQTRFEWTDIGVNVLTSASDGSGSDRRLFRLWRDGRVPPLVTPAPEHTPEPPATSTEAPPDPTAAPPQPTVRPSAHSLLLQPTP